MPPMVWRSINVIIDFKDLRRSDLSSLSSDTITRPLPPRNNEEEKLQKPSVKLRMLPFSRHILRCPIYVLLQRQRYPNCHVRPLPPMIKKSNQLLVDLMS